MPTILIDNSIPIHEASLRELKTLRNIRIEHMTPEQNEENWYVPKELLDQIDILFTTFPPQNINKMSQLKWIQIASSGYTQLFGLSLPEKGIKACNARGCFDVPIAEWNISMMINLRRNLRQMIRNQEEGKWDRSADFQQEVHGMTVGIWGYGGIGRESARVAKALGMKVKVMSRQGVQPTNNTYSPKGTGDANACLPDKVYLSGQELEFLSELDFLILAMPLSKETEGLLGENELKALPRTAAILNPARGPLIQEQALLKALTQGWIAGAAIDTHYAYPLPKKHPLWTMPNVILTPHISGSSLSARLPERLWEIFQKNIKRSNANQALLNELSKDQLSSG